jgi:hypothetical protein
MPTERKDFECSMCKQRIDNQMLARSYNAHCPLDEETHTVLSTIHYSTTIPPPTHPHHPLYVRICFFGSLARSLQWDQASDPHKSRSFVQIYVRAEKKKASVSADYIA